MTPATTTELPEIRDKSPRAASDRLVGLLIMSLFPALFWTGLIALAAAAIGQPLGTLALVSIGVAIAIFLAVVISTLVARSS